VTDGAVFLASRKAGGQSRTVGRPAGWDKCRLMVCVPVGVDLLPGQSPANRGDIELCSPRVLRRRLGKSRAHVGPERLRMGSLCVEFVPESHVDHVCSVWAMAGRADLERALRGGGRSRRACLAGRHHVAERILGTRRRLFEVRLAHHRHRVGPGSEPSSLDSKSCYACGMVRIPTECERRI